MATETSSTTKAEPSARAVMARWMREQFSDLDEVRIPDLRSQARAHFITDRGFMEKALDFFLDATFYDLAQVTVGQSRRLILSGDEIVSREVEGKRLIVSGTWKSWFEHVGSQHIRLMKMTRDDLFMAAEEREQRAAHERELAALWRELGQRLAVGQVVEDRFSEADIDAVRVELLRRSQGVVTQQQPRRRRSA